MEEARDLPGLGRVTICTLLTKQSPVLVTEPVARRAFKHFTDLDRHFAGDGCQGAPKRFHTSRRWLARADGTRRPQPGLNQDQMVDPDRPDLCSLVFDMATSALANRRVESGRLFGERECIGCVARNA